MKENRLQKIENLSNDENLQSLKDLFNIDYTQNEIDYSLETAIAYSQIKTAEYLLSKGADISSHDYNGVYHAAYNDELEGLKFAISKGVDINVNDGMILNELIHTSINANDTTSLEWILNNGADIRNLTEDSLETLKTFGSSDLKKLILEYAEKSDL